jgi:YVTN family beta-propeller protein
MSILLVGGLLTATVTGGKAPHGHLLVVNQGDKTMSIVDPLQGIAVATVNEQQTTMHGHEVATSPDGRTAYMPIYGNVGVGGAGLDGRQMLVFDVAKRTIKGRVDFGHGVRPHCAVYEPVKNLLYVTTELDETVTVIDPKSLKIIGTVPTGQEQSHMLAITKDGKRGYVSNVAPGTVSVLDLEARKIITIVSVAAATQRIALSEDDKWAFTSDATKPRMAVIDTSTNTVAKWIDLPGTGYGSAATHDGKWLLVPIPSKDEIAVVDLDTMTVAKEIPVAKSPQEMLIRPDGKFAYVAGSAARQVSEIDLTDWKVTQTIDVGSGPDGLAWAK